ncbi:SEC14-like protein 2 [Frankliniella fusca]|uniref:SEC14-like protein 2 n=1 Tax=Frankliniella fusca TaxID=407009 RepID=A0AAE1LBA4_9NEOP|nr:SEC14-like protein 2 [Frankliniella fusca]
MAPAKGLSDDQRFALMKFRRSVSDVMQPQHDDQFLLRWLRARNWDAAAAEKMLRESLRWRERYEVDQVRDWQPPEVLSKYYPSGLSGRDRDGSPVVVVPFAGLDIYGLLHSCSKREFIQMTIKQMETYLHLSREATRERGDAAHGIVAVIDMQDFNLRQWAWRPAGEVVVNLLQTYEANYPETLKNCYIINAPRVFAIAWSVVKNFLNDYTQSKIHILKDPAKWQPLILENIEPDQLPRHYGGVAEDPPGDPHCSARINQGGKVPKEYYTKSASRLQDQPDEETAVVKMGGKLKLEYIAAQKGTLLKWGFRTEGHDIKFSVTMKDIDGNCSTLVPLKRVNSHQVEEVGVITCPTPGTYTLLFDNTYSYLRSKRLHYSVGMAPPLAGSDDHDGVLDDIIGDLNDNRVQKSG